MKPARFTLPSLVLSAITLMQWQFMLPPDLTRSHPLSRLECDMRRIGRALAADTIRLHRESRSGSVDGVAEGFATTIFSEARIPRVVVATYLGETGKLTLRYYLADTKNYVVDVDRITYERPISRGNSRPASRERHFLYVCDDVVDTLRFREASSSIRATLDTLLRQRR